VSLLLQSVLIPPFLFAIIRIFFFFFFTLVRRSLRLKLSDTRVYEPQIRARLGTTAHHDRFDTPGEALFGQDLAAKNSVLKFEFWAWRQRQAEAWFTGVPRS